MASDAPMTDEEAKYLRWLWGDANAWRPVTEENKRITVVSLLNERDRLKADRDVLFEVVAELREERNRLKAIMRQSQEGFENS